MKTRNTDRSEEPGRSPEPEPRSDPNERFWQAEREKEVLRRKRDALLARFKKEAGLA